MRICPKLGLDCVITPGKRSANLNTIFVDSMGGSSRGEPKSHDHCKHQRQLACIKLAC